jgi:hypothetical protein
VAADPVKDVGHEARHRLMSCRDRLDLPCVLVKRVDKSDIAMTAEAEGNRYLLPDQVIDMT